MKKEKREKRAVELQEQLEDLIFKFESEGTKISIKQDGDKLGATFEKRALFMGKGDILFGTVLDHFIFISLGSFMYACAYNTTQNKILIGTSCCSFSNCRIATEFEKQKLFDALEKEGKKWNPEKLCIEDIKWQPANGEIYYFVTEWFTLGATSIGVSHFQDRERIIAGNYFKTRELCQISIEKIKNVLK